MNNRRKIDWKKVERLKEAGHSWEHIAYLARYWGTGESLKCSYYSWRKRVADRNESALSWPVPTEDPKDAANWPDYSTENLNLRTGRPVIAPKRRVAVYSDQPSSAGFAA